MTPALSIKQIILFITLIFPGLLWSCDFCELLEYGNSTNRSYFKLEYKRNLFKTYNQPLSTLDLTGSGGKSALAHRGLPGSDIIYLQHEDDFELYTGTFLSFNYNLNDKWNLKLGTSYVSNTDYYGLIIQPGAESSSDKEVFKGLGDLWVGAERIFYKEVKEERFRHILKLGGRVTLPTGKYNVTNVFTDNIHMQPGRPIYGLTFSSNYNFEETGFWGISANAQYYHPVELINLPTTYSYQYAKEFNAELNAYKIFNTKIKTVLLSGVKTEYSTKEFVNGFEIENTGGQRLFINLGTSFSYKKFMLQVASQVPLIQKLNKIQLKNRMGLNTALFYYFSKKSSQNVHFSKK